ncbi:MAG: YkgJ family cysteine cluster protein [Candidatus Terrybacteria bacterium]|nr:YkgJ family cysteine cluster protein [Candidatus Terrybacteria bacterium]
MKKDLWHDCLVCENKCCKWDLAFPLFTIPEEREKNKTINTKKPCVFLNDSELCEIYNSRPYDCRFFPFELMKINKKLFWIIWNVDCPIIKNRRDDFEKYLTEHEQKLIPNFIKHLENYADFRVEELKKKYKYEVLRKAVIKLL